MLKRANCYPWLTELTGLAMLTRTNGFDNCHSAGTFLTRGNIGFLLFKYLLNL